MTKQDEKLFTKLSSEAVDYTKLSGAGLYDIAIILPSINMYVNCIYSALTTDNKYSAIMSIRGMLEAVAAIAFFEYEDPTCNFFNKYLEHGRIDFDQDNREKTSISYQIECIDKISNNQGTKTIYNKLCRLVHFGKDQLLPIIEDVSFEDNGKTSFSYRISISTLDSKSKKLIHNMVCDIHQNTCEVLDYYKEHRNMDNNRSRYVIFGKSNKLLPKHYKTMSMTSL